MKKIIFFLLATSYKCFAEIDTTSGNYFQNLCQTDPFACMNFTTGLDVGLYYGVQITDLSKSIYFVQHKLGFCPPELVSNSQKKDVFVKYLEDHPEDRHEPASVLAVKSWRKAWPCY